MKNFLRKLLGIQTLKIILFNPDSISVEYIDMDTTFKKMPVFLIVCRSINDIKVIDTGIVVKKPKNG